MLEKTCSIFQITISRLPVKVNKICVDAYINDACIIRLKSLALQKLSFPTLHLFCSPYLLPKSTRFLHLFLQVYIVVTKIFQKILSLTFPLPL